MKNESPGIITATLSPLMEKTIIEAFDLSIESLQGTKKVLPDGMIRIRLVIHNEEKCQMIKEFVLKLISNSPNQILN